jgi:ABC-2 type transport system permease protein
VKVLAIAHANLSRFLRDRANIFFVFILPLGIVLLVGAQFGGEPTTAIGVSGGGDPVGELIVAELTSDERLNLTEYGSEAEMLVAVERGNVAAGVSIPADLSAQIAAGGTADVGFVSRPDGLGPQLKVVIDQAVASATARASAVRFAVAAGAQPDVAAEVAGVVTGQITPVEVQTTTGGESLFEGLNGQFDQGASTQLVLFMFLTGLAGSAALIQSRQLGVTRRMMSTPTSPGTIIAGEALGRFVVVLVQGLYIVGATILLFQVDWGNPLGAAAIIMVFAAVGAGAAMLFGTLFKNDQQAGSVGVIAGLGLAAIGGSMLPIELFSDSMQRIARFTPHAWANDAFADLLRRNASLADIIPQLGVLAGFAAALLGLAAIRMRSVITRA